jgi:hypothetical protein
MWLGCITVYPRLAPKRRYAFGLLLIFPLRGDENSDLNIC